jgi:hypothetical protein
MIIWFLDATQLMVSRDRAGVSAAAAVAAA